jgi:DNA-binding transcriptional MerR regulator
LTYYVLLLDLFDLEDECSSAERAAGGKQQRTLAPDLASYLKVLARRLDMERVDLSEWLSAADCASRTGLTVRALRVYEEFGLIAPRRSAGGWRQYGPHDLVKLNTIALLKAAGLSLAQIREVTCSSAGEPTLQQILAIQLGTWKRRRADAARGQAIAEAALGRLRADQSLSVDELCNLIRSLEMIQSQPGTAPTGRDFAWVTVDPAVLDSYAGFYRRREYGVTAIWRDGQKLFIDAPIPGSVGAVELHPTSDSEFYPTNGAGYFQYRFLRDPQGAVSSLLMRIQGIEFTCPRIDATTAEQLMAKLSERIQNQNPLPGSEVALLRLVDGIQAGNPPYEKMSSQLEQSIRLHLSLLQPLTEYLGAFQSIEFRGVGSGGWDQYDVHRERGTSRWQILLSADGKIASASLDWDRPNSAPCGDESSPPLSHRRR